jgi:hypothetical protein
MSSLPPALYKVCVPTLLHVHSFSTTVDIILITVYHLSASECSVLVQRFQYGVGFSCRLFKGQNLVDDNFL